MFVLSPRHRFEFTAPSYFVGNAGTSEQLQHVVSSPSFYQQHQMSRSPTNSVAVVSPGLAASFPCLAKQNDMPTSSHNTRPTKRVHRSHKKVRFSLQPQQVFIVPNDDVEPREWLKPEDLDRRRNADKQIGNQVSEEYVQSILFLLKSFKAEHYVGRQQLLHHVQVLLKHPEARGLEHRIVTLLKRQRIKAVHKLLRHQHNDRRNERTLRQVSLKLSRGARQLAFRLAQSDRLAAKAIHEEL